MRRERSRAALEALRQAVHRMHGTAGSYGFADVALACREWEELLKRSASAGAEPGDATVARLEAMLERLSRAIRAAEGPPA